MPYAPPSRCPCGNIATRRGRCDQHQPTPWATRSRNGDALTGRQRQQLHDQQIAREPQCRRCGSQDQLEADHIIPIAEGGAHTDPANLQTLCHNCHKQKTEAERRRGTRRRQHRPPPPQTA